MRIVGIDPGISIVGYAFLDYENNKFKALDYGSIQTPASSPMPWRLAQIYKACLLLFERFKPSLLAIEKLFFNTNKKTALTVGQARGVIILAAQENGIHVVEYTPLQVKMAVVGYGKASKKQMQEVVKLLLSLPSVPKPDDVADALAIAICGAHSFQLERL